MSTTPVEASVGPSRRGFVAAAGVVTAATLVPRHVLGGPRFVAPSQKVNIGYIGCGTQGFRQLIAALESPDIRIPAVCDPVRRSDGYPDYGNDELNNRIRKFLNDPAWANGARGALCGREVGQEIVNRHYQARGQPADCRSYADFREMLEKEKDLDAVYVMTPDHLHGVIAIKALRQGKHVITHKPLSNVLAEARQARDTAKETGLATHLFCAAGQTSTPTVCEWLEAGAIGPVREVHNWSTRPFWPQGMTAPPAGTPPVPDGFDWDLWLGPAAQRPYHPAYTHTVFRGWYDFGTGALGDMGHYSFHQIFEMLRLGSPLSVEATRSQVWTIQDYRWQKQTAHLAFPHAAHITWEFPARGELPAVMLHWYDGGLRPPTLPELEHDGLEMPAEGLLLVGELGKLLAGFSGAEPRLLPRARMRDFAPPPQRLPRPIEELDQFIRACRGGTPSDASFEKAYPFVETILLGTIAVRVNRKLRWDADKAQFTNSPQANELLHRKNRAGWEV
jgi:predicted dehydrogenase